MPYTTTTLYAAPSILDASVRRARHRNHHARACAHASATTSSSDFVKDTDDAHAVYYFAYGSNINPKTFEGVRNMRPTVSIPCVLRGYALVFNVPGVPYVEPAFASVRKVQGEEGVGVATRTHGVAHRVSREEWEYLVTTEGSYDVVDVTCKTYAGDELACKTLTHRTLANFGEQLPSKRYVQLLRDGARHYALAPEWIETLDALESYDPVELDIAARAALALSIAPTLFAAAPAALGAAAKRLAASGDGRAAVVDAFVETQDVAWGVHNAVFAPLFGSGGQNIRK